MSAMNQNPSKPASPESSAGLWITALVMLACLAGVTLIKSIPALAGLPKPVFWAFYSMPIALCLWFHLHLNRHGKPLAFLLMPIFLVATVMVLALLPDGLFAWSIQ